MLRILDRYILVYFLQTFVICFVSLTGLYIVVDALTNLDLFIAHAEEHGGLLELVSAYYGYRSIVFFDQTSAILALLAAILTVLWLKRHNELTAILSAGVSKTRVLAPVLIPALLIGVIAAANRECVLPRIRGELMRDAKSLGAGEGRPAQPRVDAQTGIILDGKSVLAATKQIERPYFMLPRGLARFGSQLRAKSATYHAATEGRPAGYLLDGVTTPDRLAASPSQKLGESAVLLTPTDHDWLSPDQVFVVSGVPFEQLAGGGAWKSYASTAELIENARSPSVDVVSDLQVAVHARFIRPFLDATLLFIGLPLVLTRRDRNPFLLIGLAIAVVALFMGVMVTCQFLGANHWTSPALAAWLPLIIFAPVAVAMRGSLTS